LYQHYKALAETGEKIIIYNVRAEQGQNVEASTTLRLANEFPNLFCD
jgi:4-hydroxy-tetrahydrodipicolinate synthase